MSAAGWLHTCVAALTQPRTCGPLTGKATIEIKEGVCFFDKKKQKTLTTLLLTGPEKSRAVE
jgi:hypothetical protein